MTSVSKQDLTTSVNSLSVNDVNCSVREYKKTRTLSRALIFGLVVSLCICLVLVIALAVVVTRYSDRDDDKTVTSKGTVLQQQQQPLSNANQGCPPTNNQQNTNVIPQPATHFTNTRQPNTNQGSQGSPSPPLNAQQPGSSHNTQQPGSSLNTQQQDELCLTTDCIRAASSISNSIDETINPCDDFYKFACGNWRRRNVMTEDQAQIGIFNKLRDDVDIILKNVLEKAVDRHDIEAVKKAKNMYQSCLDEQDIENAGFGEVKSLLESIGGWPVLGNKAGGKWNSTTKLEDQLAAIRRYSNSPPIMDMDTYDDSKDTTNNILYIDQPVLGMPDRKYFLKGRNDKTLKAYETYALDVAKIFGADPSTAATDIADMIDFEIHLANMSMPEDQRRDANKLYNKKDINQLQSDYPDFHWLTYFNEVLGDSQVQITVTSSENVIVRNPDYINRIFEYVRSVPDRVVSNYIVWRFVDWVSKSLPESVREAQQSYREVLVGTKNARPRWKDCASFANNRLGLAVGRLFVNEAFDKVAKKNALEMIENLRSSMKNMIRQNDWMDEETKTVALDKADHVTERIGYYDDILQDAFLNDRYENYTVTNDKFLRNTVNYRINIAAENLRKLRKPVDRITWDEPPAIVNAFYNPPRNQISFPAGILQPPFYHRDFPQYLNYGGIGYVIGHEITHGFDDHGRMYDKNGELKSWWTQHSIDTFKTRTQCFIDQYGNYTVPEANKKLNGKLTLGENIADNGGVKESFYAYGKWVKEHGEEAKLPGLKYTPIQLFFLNTAHVHCDKIRPAEALRRIIVDVHSDSHSRAIGPLQNFEEFSKAFNCPVGSFMNPVKKCTVW